MKFIYWKYALILLIAISALVIGLYLENKFPDTYAIDKIEFNTAATIGLTRGELICSESAKIKFRYENMSRDVSLKQICGVLDNGNGNS